MDGLKDTGEAITACALFDHKDCLYNGVLLAKSNICGIHYRFGGNLRI